MKTTFVLALAVVCFVGYSCSNSNAPVDSTAARDSVVALLQGKWVWIYSISDGFVTDTFTASHPRAPRVTAEFVGLSLRELHTTKGDSVLYDYTSNYSVQYRLVGKLSEGDSAFVIVPDSLRGFMLESPIVSSIESIGDTLLLKRIDGPVWIAYKRKVN